MYMYVCMYLLSVAMLCYNAWLEPCLLTSDHDHPCSPLLHSGHSSKPSTHSRLIQMHLTMAPHQSWPVSACRGCMVEEITGMCIVCGMHIMLLHATYSTHETWVMSSKHWVIMSLLLPLHVLPCGSECMYCCCLFYYCSPKPHFELSDHSHIMSFIVLWRNCWCWFNSWL